MFGVVAAAAAALLIIVGTQWDADALRSLIVAVVEAFVGSRKVAFVVGFVVGIVVAFVDASIIGRSIHPSNAPKHCDRLPAWLTSLSTKKTVAGAGIMPRGMAVSPRLKQRKTSRTAVDACDRIGRKRKRWCDGHTPS